MTRALTRIGAVPQRARRGWVLTTVLAVAFGIAVIPFYWLIIASTHTDAEIFSYPPNLLPGTAFVANLAGLDESIGLGRVLFNSIFVSTVHTLLGVAICLMAGYAFAKFRFRGSNAIFLMLMVALVIPSQVTLVPLFQMMLSLNWLDTYQAIILPNLAVPFGIFLMRQALSALPDELIDAARVDGCGEFRLLLQVVVPVMRPTLAALSIFLFLGQWNDFVWPLIALRSPEMYTLPVALASLHGLSETDYGQLMIGTTVAAVPIMIAFLVLQRQFIAGITAGATKG